MIYWRCYIESYEGATRDLSMIEDGAYFRLLRYYYANERPIPLSQEKQYELTRAIKPEAQAAVDSVIRDFFVKQADGYHNARADHEIKVSQTARKNGEEGGRPPGEKSVDKPKRETKKRTGGGTGTITDKVTGEITEHITGSGTGEVTQSGTGSGHPPNHLTTNPPNRQSLSSPKPGETPPELGTSRPRRGASPPVSDEHHGNGKALAEPKADQPAPARFASDSEIPWWHSPAGIQAMGVEQRLQLGADEDWREYSARVMAAAGPGPWDQEQPSEQRERIEQFRAMRSA